MRAKKVWYLRTTPLIETQLRLPGANAEARKKAFYSLCAKLGLRALGKREGAGEWLWPVVEVRRRVRAYTQKNRKTS